MDALRERAAGLLREAGGSLPADTLASALFGGGGQAWTAMLETTLADPRFQRDADCWRLVEERQSDGLVAFSIETTGQDPARHALVQIAACRIENGRPGPAFHTYVNPERRIPTWLAERLGVDRGLGDEAPSLTEALTLFREFIGDATLVGFDAGWAQDFLRFNCWKAAQPSIDNPVRDLLPEAARLAGSAKPALGPVAQRLGIPIVRRHRGTAEATLLAELACRLDATTATPAADRLVGMVELMPDAPGVYIFRGQAGEPLYVGKAKRLRSRVLSYLTRPADRERDLGGLRSFTASLDWQTTPDDLAAILLEAELIAEHRPRFNTQRRASPAPALLELSPVEPFPRLRRVAETGAGRFGPFSSGTVASREAALLTSIFPLRTCTRKIGVARKTKPRPPCVLLALGRCLGPCTGELPSDDYSALVAKASAFLAGDRRVGLAELQRRAREAAERGDRSEADRLLALLRSLSTRWSGDLLAPGFDPANIALLLPRHAPTHAYIVLDGHLRWHGPLDRLADFNLDRLPDDASRRGGILTGRWLTTNRRHAAIVPLPGGADLNSVIERIEAAH